MLQQEHIYYLESRHWLHNDNTELQHCYIVSVKLTELNGVIPSEGMCAGKIQFRIDLGGRNLSQSMS